MAVTAFQENEQKVYALLSQIPSGRVSTYAALAAFLHSSPRAVGGACARNPFAPEVPCHRCVSSTGFVGGFMGDWEKTASGVNVDRKLALLKDEGVTFDERGMLRDRSVLWSDFRV
ncbi:MAG: hypothetical protein M1832_003953 [Thelocarpon impressellum]|nr:MAG: hypothetical protein M1832_003953 [Thelocarpon impressellum]